MSPPGLVLRHASLTFGDRPLFQALQARFDAGSWTCLLGRSGSGKSSLLRMIASLRLPDNHHLDLQTSDGIPLAGRVAWMAQQDLLVPWQRVAGNVMLSAHWQGRPTAADRRRAEHLLAQVGLADKADRWPDELSGGQRQRIALARTLFADASVVLMDEPFSAVDAITRLELHDLASRLLADRTVLMVTHDPLEALRLADRILILQGEPARLVSISVPPGDRPRSLDDSELQRRQAELVTQLRETDDA
ncbi:MULTISPECIES: ABC transporter ATP-binding protein [Salinicola]|uniref:ABC transporter ATP-binding protein n=1 Tax=Salinicola socius TaxID=404433 RepID=A0A1Q8SW73_9GAMM|nr:MULTISPECIES: ABC transporter ATP-binding protein [Salinicola]OLO05674.1 ABC transporter ATP-binding protein [Salinicola socius]